jgi:hypothetical protein
MTVLDRRAADRSGRGKHRDTPDPIYVGTLAQDLPLEISGCFHIGSYPVKFSATGEGGQAVGFSAAPLEMR